MDFARAVERYLDAHPEEKARLVRKYGWDAPFPRLAPAEPQPEVALGCCGRWLVVATIPLRCPHCGRWWFVWRSP